MVKLTKKKNLLEVIPISYYKNLVDENIESMKSIIKDFKIEQSVIEFLLNPCKNFDYTKKEALDVVNELVQLKSLKDGFFISFLGITRNNDCIDNFGHSRVLRTMAEDNDKEYNLLTRPWYIEAIENEELVSISSPYLAESGAYVVSVLKKILDDKGNLIGILGIDVLFSTVAQLKNGDNIIVFMSDGIILYNSHPQLKNIIEKQNNIIYMVGYPAFSKMITEKTGLINSKYCNKVQNIEFTSIFNDRFILLKTEKL